jgi:rRNA maturation RNase YbeY
MSRSKLQWAPPEFWSEFPLRETSEWIEALCLNEKFRLKRLVYCAVSDDELALKNEAFLEHTDFTDVLSFSYAAAENVIEGEVWISRDRIKDNASKRGLSELEEWLRVLSHGLYHLSGMTDKSLSQRLEMRSKEDAAIGLYKRMFHVEQ